MTWLSSGIVAAGGGTRRAAIRSLALLAAVFILFALVQAVWLARDRRPVVEEQHLFAALRLAHALRGDEVGRAYPDQGYRSPYPPLVVYLSAPLLALGGTRADAAVLTLLPFVGLLLWSAWRAARQYCSPPAALTAAVLLLAFHHFVVAEERYPPYPFLKEYLLDLPLSALVALTLTLLLLLRERATFPRQAALGVAMGLGALTKVSYPVYLVILLAALLLEPPRDLRRWRRILLPPALLGALLALPWYLLHARDLLLDLSAREFSGAWAAECGKPPVCSLAGFLYYPRLLVSMLSPSLALLVVIAAAVVVWRRAPGRRLAAGGMLVSYLLLSLLLGKSERMLAPCLVFAALAVAGLVDQVRPATLRAAFVLVLLTLAGFRMACQHGFVPGYRDPSGLAAAELAPVADDWSAGRIMRELERRRDPSTLLRVSVVPHLGHFGHNALMQYALEHDLRLAPESEWRVRGENWADELERSEFIITKEGDNGPARFTPRRADIEAWVAAKQSRQPSEEFAGKGGAARLGSTVSLVERYPLPDGSYASLYRQARTFAWERRTAPRSPRALAVFDDSLVLTDVRLTRSGETLKVSCEWQARRTPRREYRLFIQVRRGLGNLEARTFVPGEGLLPIIDWAPGSVLAEDYTLPLPAACREGPCEVWLGWHRGWRRLPVTATSLPQFLRAVRVGELQ